LKASNTENQFETGFNNRKSVFQKYQY